MANACKQQNNVSEAGIGKLSLLPLFLNLKGKRVIVIGASQGAKWKAELLAAAGAQVEHCDTAPTPGSALLEYLGDAAFAIASPNPCFRYSGLMPNPYKQAYLSLMPSIPIPAGSFLTNSVKWRSPRA